MYSSCFVRTTLAITHEHEKHRPSVNCFLFLQISCNVHTAYLYLSCNTIRYKIPHKSRMHFLVLQALLGEFENNHLFSTWQKVQVTTACIPEGKDHL